MSQRGMPPMPRSRPQTGSAPSFTGELAAGARRRPATGSLPAPPASALPTWFWGLIGCMSVLVIRFAGLGWAWGSGVLLGGRAEVASGDGSRGAAGAARRGQIQVEQMDSPPPPAPAAIARNEARRVVPHPRPAVAP